MRASSSVLALVVSIAGFVSPSEAASRAKAVGVVLSTHRDPAQGAFTILVPEGWKAEGGMLPSGVSWNVVDLVENNIRFRVSHPDGKSFYGWYPRFYFQDPAIIARSRPVVPKPATSISAARFGGFLPEGASTP